MTIQFHSLQLGQSGQLPRCFPVLLFLHGFMGSVEDWRLVMEYLSHDYTCLALDLPGHGRTDCQTGQDYTTQATAEAIVRFLNSMQIPTAIPIGYSMGGRLSLYCALRFPQRFPQAVVESGSPGLRKHEERKRRQDQDFERSQQLEIHFLHFLRAWYQQPLFTTLQRFSTGFEAMWERRLKNRPAELSRSLQNMGLGSQPNLWSQLEFHHNPLLLLTGELDQKFTQLNNEMANCCKTAVHQIVPDAGHNIHLEQPEMFVSHIQSWLESKQL